MCIPIKGQDHAYMIHDKLKREDLGPAWWHRGLNYYLQHQHSVWED